MQIKTDRLSDEMSNTSIDEQSLYSEQSFKDFFTEVVESVFVTQPDYYLFYSQENKKLN